jgi:hypothetical protein
MEFANQIRQITQNAVIAHVVSIQRQTENEVHLYMEQILPRFTQKFFVELMATVGHTLTISVNYPGHPDSPVTITWRHPVVAGTGPGFFQITSEVIKYGLNGNIDTRVQAKVRDYLKERGWTCWWTIDSFCFQDRLDFEAVEKGMRLFACYRNEGAGDLLISDA